MKFIMRGRDEAIRIGEFRADCRAMGVPDRWIGKLIEPHDTRVFTATRDHSYNMLGHHFHRWYRPCSHEMERGYCYADPACNK